MQAADVAEIYTVLLEHGVQLWLDGGWGIDALLQQQTRPHKDLDAFVQVDDLGVLASILAGRGFQLKEIWSENRWIPHPLAVQLIGSDQPDGPAVASAFVLRDEAGREIDIHVLRFTADGVGVPAWNTELRFAADAFAGRGMIEDTPVCCLSPQMHMLTHSGYTLLEKDLQDLRLLQERFGLTGH